MMLRVHDGLVAGASQREMAAALFGTERVPAGWSAESDSSARASAGSFARRGQWRPAGTVR
jgi:hypothetical protein